MAQAGTFIALSRRCLTRPQPLMGALPVVVKIRSPLDRNYGDDLARLRRQRHDVGLPVLRPSTGDCPYRQIVAEFGAPHPSNFLAAAPSQQKKPESSPIGRQHAFGGFQNFRSRRRSTRGHEPAPCLDDARQCRGSFRPCGDAEAK